MGAQIRLNGNEYGDSLTVRSSVVDGGRMAVDSQPGWSIIWESTSNLQDMSVAFGTLVSGGILDLTGSDDRRVGVRSRFGFAAARTHIADLRIGAIASLAAPEFIDLTFEGFLSHPGGQGRLRLRNWTTGNFFRVRDFSIGTIEIVEFVEGIDATDFVRASDGRIEVSVFTSSVATFSVGGFDAFTEPGDRGHALRS